jgi:hypothetical protein
MKIHITYADLINIIWHNCTYPSIRQNILTLHVSTDLSHIQGFLCIFLIRIVGGGVQLCPLDMSATNWPILPAQGDYEDEEFRGVMMARETEVLGENLAQCHYVHHKSRMTWPDANPGLRCGKPTTNCLNYGKAIHTFTLNT